MSKKVYDDFRRIWLKQYIEQYKKGDRKTRTEIKRNVYKNTGLTENEKDMIWEAIIRFGFLNSDE